MTGGTVTVSVSDYPILSRAVGLYWQLRGAHGPASGEDTDGWWQMNGAQERAKNRLSGEYTAHATRPVALAHQAWVVSGAPP